MGKRNVLSYWRKTKCSIHAAKRAFYRSANAIFDKIGRIAFEEVTLQLIQSKSVPLLLYGQEACPLNKSQLNSLDFVINRFFMKLFETSHKNMVESLILRRNSVLFCQVFNWTREGKSLRRNIRTLMIAYAHTGSIPGDICTVWHSLAIVS